MHVPVLSCVRASMCVRPCVRALPHHDASVCVRVRACACVSVLCARVRACACIVDEAGQSSNRWCGVCVGGGGGLRCELVAFSILYVYVHTYSNEII